MTFKVDVKVPGKPGYTDASGTLTERPSARVFGPGSYLVTDVAGGKLSWSDGTSWTYRAPGLTESQPLDSDLTAIAALSTTAYGRALLTQASASAARTYLGIPARYDLQRDFGAVGDGVILTDGAITTGTAAFSSTSAVFTAADAAAHKPILVLGAGVAGANLLTTIQTFTNSTHVVLAANASTSVSGAFAVYGTDDTAAVQSAVTQMVTDGQALCGVGTGIYVLAAAPVTGTSVIAQVTFPGVPSASAQQKSVGFVGASIPPGTKASVLSYGYVDWLSNGGSVFCSLQTAPAGAYPCVFAADEQSAGEISKLWVVMHNLTVRAPAANGVAALALNNAMGCDLDNLRVDVIGNPPSGIPQPTSAYSFGITLPRVGNGARVRVGGLDISGYTYGFVPNEHMSAQWVNVSFCDTAVVLADGYFGGWISRLCTFNCIHHFLGTVTANPCPLVIGLWEIENAVSSWYATTDHAKVTGSNLLCVEVFSFTNNVSAIGRVVAGPTITGAGVSLAINRQTGSINAVTDWVSVTGGVGFTTTGGVTWVDYTSAQKVQYRIRDDMVELRGWAKSGTAGTTIFTLPAGFRPVGRNHVQTIDADGVLGLVQVSTTGGVACGTGTAAVILDGIRFSVQA